MQCCYLDYGWLQSSSDVIAAGGYCRRFIMHPDVCPSTDSKRRPYRFEIFSFQNYLDISNIDGSVLNCSIAVANALETPQSLTNAIDMCATKMLEGASLSYHQTYILPEVIFD